MATKTVLGRTHSASWSQEVKRKMEECKKHASLNGDRLVGQCVPALRVPEWERARIRRELGKG